MIGKIPNYIDDSVFCGQTTVKNKINFYLHSARNGGILPPIILADRRGSGKTTLARLIGKNLLDNNGKPRKFIEVNGASIKKLSSFVTELIIPHVENQFCTVFLDETETICDEVLDWLLSVVCPNVNNKSIVKYEDSTIEFDYNKCSLVFATTNAEKLRLSLLSRLTRIEFDYYNHNDLIQVLYKNSDFVRYIDGIEEKIVNVCRDSPRQVVKVAREDVINYCKIKQKTTFGATDWILLSNQIGIKPLGLSNTEIGVLRLLQERGIMSLTGIAASMGLDSTTVRRDVESFLLKKNLISINAKRAITIRGQAILKEIV